MVNITQKNSSLRKAIATAIVRTSKTETIIAVEQKKVPKGDIFEFSRAAGLLAIKKTSDVIPDCHPLPIEFAAITYNIKNLTIEISVEVHTIYKTGVEVEAMHGAAVTALVMYDMLKPIDKGVEIEQIKLAQKTGGKSDIKTGGHAALKSAVVVCSDSVSSGIKEDFSGKAIVSVLEKHDIRCSSYEVVPDDVTSIRTATTKLLDDNYDLILYTGGTGLSKRDVTPDALMPLITRLIPGVMETARHYGQQRNKHAMLSRGVAGFINNTLVITLPGSKTAAEETLAAVFPHVLHVFDVKDGHQH